MVRYFYPATNVGECTVYQIKEMMKDLCEIKKLEAGEDHKEGSKMSATDKIEQFERQGLI